MSLRPTSTSYNVPGSVLVCKLSIVRFAMYSLSSIPTRINMMMLATALTEKKKATNNITAAAPLLLPIVLRPLIHPLQRKQGYAATEGGRES